MKQPGQTTDRTVLNVIASARQQKRYMLDSLKVFPASAAVTDTHHADMCFVMYGCIFLTIWRVR